VAGASQRIPLMGMKADEAGGGEAVRTLCRVPPLIALNLRSLCYTSRIVLSPPWVTICKPGEPRLALAKGNIPKLVALGRD
jgi:hypothetical protein